MIHVLADGDGCPTCRQSDAPGSCPDFWHIGDEQRRRDLAYAHRGEVVPDSGVPVEPKEFPPAGRLALVGEQGPELVDALYLAAMKAYQGQCWVAPNSAGLRAAVNEAVRLTEQRVRAEIAEDPETCPVDHRCDGAEPCGCWCEVHDCRINECPTFRMVQAGFAVLIAERDRARSDTDRQRKIADAAAAERNDLRDEFDRYRREAMQFARRADVTAANLLGAQRQVSELTAERDGFMETIRHLTARADSAEAALAEANARHAELLGYVEEHRARLASTPDDRAPGEPPADQPSQIGHLDRTNPEAVLRAVDDLDRRLRWMYCHYDNEATAGLFSVVEIAGQREGFRAELRAMHARAESAEHRYDQVRGERDNALRVVEAAEAWVDGTTGSYELEAAVMAYRVKESPLTADELLASTRRENAEVNTGGEG